MSVDTRPRRRGSSSAASWLTGSAPLVGIALIAIGVVLLLDRAGVLDAAEVLAGWWPLAVVVAGVRWVLLRARLLGGLTIALGALLLAASLEAIDAQPGRLVLPVLLVVVGTGLLRAGLALRRVPMTRLGDDDLATGGVSVFGDVRLSVGDGDREVSRRTVATTAVFGDVHVDVPPGWRVEDRITSLFGSVRVPKDQPTYAEAPTVELYGMAVFGDVRARYLDVTEDD